jgi:hypothetical protein
MLCRLYKRLLTDLQEQQSMDLLSGSREKQDSGVGKGY